MSEQCKTGIEWTYLNSRSFPRARDTTSRKPSCLISGHPAGQAGRLYRSPKNCMQPLPNQFRSRKILKGITLRVLLEKSSKPIKASAIFGWDRFGPGNVKGVGEGEGGV